jgi:uncharacterized membrane protein
MHHIIRWVAWNLFLAVIPVALGYVCAWGMGKPRRLPPLLGLPLLVVWLAFLPNTCYLLTEWRHLLFDERWAGLLGSGAEDRSAMLQTAKVALFFLVYSGAGVLTFTLAVRPVEGLLRARRLRFFVFAPVIFFLTSLGVYLGLIVRLNSWDLWHRPGYVWQVGVEALMNPTLLTSILLFAGILWGMYEAVDIWVDGVMERLRRWGIVRRPGAPVRAE